MASAAGRASAGIESRLRRAERLVAADPASAAAEARAVLQLDPACAPAFRLLAAALRSLGDVAAAEKAELDAIAASVHDPILMQAGRALAGNDLPTAEPLLRQRLREDPVDVAAIRMMAELAARIGRYVDAENLLKRALELAPAFTAATLNLAMVYQRQNWPAEAIALLDGLLRDDQDNPAAQSLKAAALGRTGGYEEALRLYEALLGRYPDQAKIWMSYGHILKTVGRQPDAIDAYRRAIAVAPTLGEVWWSLANLKTVRFGSQEIGAMERALEEPDLAEDDRFHLHFALGKAMEDSGDHAQAFAHYAEGNRLRRAQLDYDPEEIDGYVARAPAVFTRGFFEERQGFGHEAADPIFILGMPRAGSTLIEQILASHPLVEGTMELPDVPAMVKRLGEGRIRYLDALEALGTGEARALGQDYLERTRIQRKTDRPMFIDKMPNNWAHVPFIHLMLPNAKIIDARRHPLACCFSNFKQHFARGQAFTYDLAEVGRYYASYVRFMAHLDSVLPGRVHRVIHERLVDDPETEVRALLDHVGLPFDQACLRFHENERAVRTASSEQVRRPLNREGFDQWQPFEQWLGPLKETLGDVLHAYPEAPESVAD